MGILKSKEEKRKEKIPGGYTFKNKNKEQVFIHDFKYEEDMNMVTAKFKIGKESEKDICIVIPQDKSIMDMIKLEIFEGLDQLGKFDDLQSEKYNVLGRIIKNVNEKNTNQPFFLLPTQEEEKKHIDERLNARLKQKNSLEREAFAKQLREQNYNKKDEEIKAKIQEELVKQFENKIKEEERMLPIEVLEKRQERKQKPKLRIKAIDIVENIYGEGKELAAYYEGTDMTTGEVIRLNHTTFKEIDNKYIYTTFISNTDIEGSKPPKSKIPYGNPVIFELPYEIGNIVNDKNMGKIKPILELLSRNPETVLEKDKMKFLGSVEYGKVQREMVSNEIVKKEIVKEIGKYKELVDKDKELERDEN